MEDIWYSFHLFCNCTLFFFQVSPRYKAAPTFARRSLDDSFRKMFQRFRMPGSRDGERKRRIADIACMSIPSTVRMPWTTWMPVPRSLGAIIERLQRRSSRTSSTMIANFLLERNRKRRGNNCLWNHCSL